MSSQKGSRHQTDRQNVQPPKNVPAKVCIIAGEVSGEELALELVDALKAAGVSQFFGTGGDKLQAAGMQLWGHIDFMAAVGFSEVARKYIQLRRLTTVIADRCVAKGIELAVLVDYPGFNMILARKLFKRGIPVYYYVSPQVWAWKEKRVNVYARYGRAMYCLFPFEVPYYTRAGLQAFYFGHPFARRIAQQLTEEGGLERLTAAAQTSSGSRPIFDKETTITLMPGSRTREVEALFEVMLGAVSRLLKNKSINNKFTFLVPTVREKHRDYMQAALAAFAENEGLGNSFTGMFYFLERRSLSAMNNSRLVITTSGTSTLEACWLGTPMVIMYKVSTISYHIFKRLIKVKYLGIVNILADREICREFLQNDCTVDGVYNETAKLLSDDHYAGQMKTELNQIRQSLDLGDPSPKIVESILADIKNTGRS